MEKPKQVLVKMNDTNPSQQESSALLETASFEQLSSTPLYERMENDRIVKEIYA